MRRTRTIAYASLAFVAVVVAVAAGSIVAIDEPTGDGTGAVPTAEPAMAQQPAMIPGQQRHDLLFPPGQYVYSKLS